MKRTFLLSPLIIFLFFSNSILGNILERDAFPEEGKSALFSDSTYNTGNLHAFFMGLPDSLASKQGHNKKAVHTVIFPQKIAAPSNSVDSSKKEISYIHEPQFITNIPTLICNEDDSLIIDQSAWSAFVSGTRDSLLHFNLKATEHINSGADSIFTVLKPLKNWFGTDSLQLIVFSETFSDTTYIPIQVQALNDAPQIQNPLRDQWAFANSFFSYTIAEDVFFDPDPGDSLHYSASLVNEEPLPSWLVFDATTHNFSGRPQMENMGNLSIKLSVNDDSLLNVTDTFRIEIFDINEPPVIESLPDLILHEDSSLIIEMSNWFSYVSDPEHADSMLKFILLSATNIHAAKDSNRIIIKPVGNWFGEDLLQLKVSDGELFDSSEIKITVLPVNDPPRLLSPMQDQQAYENLPFSFTFPEDIFEDPDVLDSLYYSASLVDADSLPAWLNFYSHTNTLSGIPDSNDTGIITLKITAVDNSAAFATDTIRIEILYVNQAPVIMELPDLNFNEDDSLVFSLNYWYTLFSDAEQPDSTLQFFIVSNQNLSSDVDSNRIIIKAAENWFGHDSLQLIVSDGLLSDTSFIVVKVAAVNDAPRVLRMIENKKAFVNTFFSFVVPEAVFEDPDQTDSLSFSVSLADSGSLPLWLNYEEDKREFSGIPDTNSIGVMKLRVTVTDDSLVSINNEFNIEIFDINKPPVISVLPGLVFNEDDSLVFSIANWYGFVSDRELADSMLSFFLEPAENVKTYSDSNKIIFKSRENWFGEELLQLIVSDGGQSDTAQISINVLAINDPPQITHMPDSIVLYLDSVMIFTMKDYVSDVETADSALSWTFQTSTDSLLIHFDSTSTRLSLRLIQTVPRINLIYSVADDSMLSVTDTIVIKMGVISKITKQIELPLNEHILQQNFPNPFNAATQIEIYIPETEFVSLKIYNILGQEVKSLVSKTLSPGTYIYFWDATNFSSGIYYYKLETGSGFIKVKRAVLMK